jgi:hypothetical protein
MDDESAWMGTRHVWGQKHRFGLTTVDRRHHTYIVGKTGSGKTTLLRNLILQDVYADRGVGVIDPHGDLAYDFLDLIPSHRSQDLMYFESAGPHQPIAVNHLEQILSNKRHLSSPADNICYV